MKKNQELTVITAFFDIGRKDFSEFSRSNEQYLEYFKFWARIKNNIVVYTNSVMAKKVEEVRKKFGLLDKTKIVIINDFLAIEPELYKEMEKIANNQTFLLYRYIDNPADNNAKYDYVMLLKSWCMKDAVEKGYAKGQLAWIDFGFNHGGKVYTKPEEFDFLWKTNLPEDKITLFSIKEDDQKPLFQIIQSYNTYIMGALYIVPSNLAKQFWLDNKEAMQNLIDFGFIDDDQTLLLMISRKYKERYQVIKSDWFMPLKEFGGEHLTIKEKENKKQSLKDRIITKLRIIKRNYNCSKRLKKIFYKKTIEKELKMKFSIIVPVYNVEKYVEKCLESVNNQTYQDYEVIIVNDGSKDKTDLIIKKYIKDKNKFIYLTKENGGLSDARNYGIKYTQGDYIIILDSDDYIEKDLLKELNTVLSQQEYDIVRYGMKLVDDNGNLLKLVNNITYKGNNKNTAILEIINSEFVEPAWLYTYNLKFWKKNNFQYQKGKIHEDYGLTPLILSKAKTIGFLDYHVYNYVQRENSIMSQTDYKKIQKRVKDFKDQYLNLIDEIPANSKSNKLIISFISEALIYKGRELNDDDRKDFIKFLKKNKVIANIYNLNLKKTLTKYYLKLNLKKRLAKLSKQFYKTED